MIINESPVYEALKKHLGKEPRQDIWDELVHAHYVDQAISDGNMDELFKHYREQDKRYPMKRTPKKLPVGVYEEPPDERLKYLSEILAWDAAQEPDVKKFRIDELGDHLLKPDEVGDWMKELNNKEDAIPPSLQIHARLPPRVGPTMGKAAPDFTLTIDKKSKIYMLSLEIMFYSIAGSQIVGSIHVKPGAVSERIRKISETLHLKYTWPRSQAVGFVLTGMPPVLPLARTNFLHLGRSILSNVSVELSGGPPIAEPIDLFFSDAAERNVQPSYPSLMTLNIELSPHLSPKEVSRLYSRARLALLQPKRRYRPISKPHLELAVYYHTHRGMGGKEMMMAWNNEHPLRKPYLHVSNFDRDAKYAHERLIGRTENGSVE